MGTRLFVGNLSYNVTEQELRDTFSSEGIEVRSVRVALDRETGRPRGFAFVETTTDEGARASIERLSGRMLQGRGIKIEEAQARPPRDPNAPRPPMGPRPGGFGGPPRGPGGFGGPPRGPGGPGGGGFGGPPRSFGPPGPPRFDARSGPGPSSGGGGGGGAGGPPGGGQRWETKRERPEKKRSTRPKPEERERGNWRWNGKVDED